MSDEERKSEMSKKTERAVVLSKKFKLPFIIDNRGDYLIMDWEAMGGYGCRPATAPEQQLWNALTSAHAKATKKGKKK